MPKPAPTGPTLYETLHVHPNADTEVISAAARALLTKHHPDRGGDTEVCSRISEAKATLEDEKRRDKYDAQLRASLDNLIGPYRMTRKIAEGGFGRVYEAEHVTLGEKVCIKHTINISPEDTALLVKETKALWDLRHHAIPAIRDFYQLPDGSCALVMSYVPGPTLEQVLEEYRAKKKKLDPENACWIMERVLDALRYVHYHGVVHGDVKPQNIIVQPQEHTCCLVDFGLSSVRPDSKTRAEGYTEAFASPEALAGNTILPESDLYSLGLTMIYALGGDPRTRKVPASVPESVREFVADLLVYDVTKRPHWADSDLVIKLRDVRKSAFGRDHTNFKKI